MDSCCPSPFLADLFYSLITHNFFLLPLCCHLNHIQNFNSTDFLPLIRNEMRQVAKKKKECGYRSQPNLNPNLNLNPKADASVLACDLQ